MVTRSWPPAHRLFIHALCACACVLFGAADAARGATSLDEYRNRVNDSKKLVEGVSWLHMEASEGAEGESEARPDIEDEIIAADSRMPDEVRRQLPPTEEVEWASGRLSVDNAWVHLAIEDYERSAGSSHETRALALIRIAERLGALVQRLAELEAASSAPTPRDKEAEKGQLAAILRRLESSKAKPQESSALSRIIKQIEEWLQNLFPKSSPIQPGASPRLSIAAQIFIFGLAFSVIAFVLWKLRAQIFRRRLKKTRSKGEARIVLGERLAPDETAADLLAEAERLARGGDPRGAIRKAYVALLCELGDRKIIRLAHHKTNRDYLGAVRERPELYSEMKPLTMNYEKHWYGFETATDGDWSDFRARCRRAISPKSKVQSPKSENVSEV